MPRAQAVVHTDTTGGNIRDTVECHYLTMCYGSCMYFSFSGCYARRHKGGALRPTPSDITGRAFTLTAAATNSGGTPHRKQTWLMAHTSLAHTTAPTPQPPHHSIAHPQLVALLAPLSHCGPVEDDHVEVRVQQQDALRLYAAHVQQRGLNA